MAKIIDFVNYGVPLELAERAKRLNLTKAKIQAFRRPELMQMGLSEEDVKCLKDCLVRVPIPDETVYLLLGNSNSTCCVCKGQKGQTYIIHHIKPYATSQDNKYENLIVLCPSCHDIAHHPSGLTLGISAKNLRKRKADWENEVALANSHRAAAQFKITSLGVDYANITRLEQACRGLLGEIPALSGAKNLRNFGVRFHADGTMNIDDILERLSNGRFLFNFPGSASSLYWIELVEQLGSVVPFHDINAADTAGVTALHSLSGQFAFYTGFCQGERVPEPIRWPSDPINVSAELDNVVINFAVDPLYLLSATAISRIRERNRYAVYFWIRSVDTEPAMTKTTISAIPLLIAAPAGFNGFSNIPWIPTNEYERHMMDRESRKKDDDNELL
ncbi:HNH endonuclease [Gluconacetobacter azotocaptans]|uniref:HNH endonuclease n=1 Tax=Gluconacetobacter azotocaptans TaxID=142834 RepID=A0A7W4PFM9_9PROT|nr:HNH endonuclease signature motif containing protein [Gluconacetobacter azotocaptans]MBB2190754.1 HNH endonuclease [Gluconacetobacter azotocaptans]GBQ30679.1 hypothetical protein AA13594_1818 [Gluconacetobacter azotocaptans DSM 13594]